MIAIIDYKAGNIRSVENALKRFGAEYVLTADPEMIRRADHVILPGVGEASSAMKALESTGLAPVIKSLTQPVLGICIGMQLMCASSDEGDTECLGIFTPKVTRFPGNSRCQDPSHRVGYNLRAARPAFRNIPEDSFVYYVHSYSAGIFPDQTVAATEYAGVRFSGALQRDNFFGTQFHPEKSGSVGAEILKNFIEYEEF